MKSVAKPGATLKEGRYQIEALLREAPGKEVYLARDYLLDCAVVVDAIPIEAVASGQYAAKWEVRLLGKLGDHRNIASVIDHWDDDEAWYIVTRYLSGGSLQDVIDKASAAGLVLPAEQILGYALQLARALEHIHSRRIVHRDLQPRNVLLDEWGTLHLVDFDMAISLDDRDAPAISDDRSVEYMAPEIAAGEVGDIRADLYSLGTAIGAICAAGAGATTAASSEIPRQKSLQERSDLTEGFTSLLSDLTSTRREDRPASADVVVARIRGLVTDEASVKSIINAPETDKQEFKSSLRTPVGPRDPKDTRTESELARALELEVVKTIAAFLNTRGGTLVIGVGDDKTVHGIEVDFPSTRNSRDGWRQSFDNLVSKRLTPAALGWIDLRLRPYRGRTIALIECQFREQPTWIDDDLFVRRTASTEKLSTKQAWDWCREHWKGSA